MMNKSSTNILTPKSSFKLWRFKARRLNHSQEYQSQNRQTKDQNVGTNITVPQETDGVCKLSNLQHMQYNIACVEMLQITTEI